MILVPLCNTDCPEFQCINLLARILRGVVEIAFFGFYDGKEVGKEVAKSDHGLWW